MMTSASVDVDPNPGNFDVLLIGSDSSLTQIAGVLSQAGYRALSIPSVECLYAISDCYVYQAIFILSDIMQVYSGSRFSFVQRLRFGPNVNTPVLCFMKNEAKDAEMEMLLKNNVVNSILNPTHLQWQILRQCVEACKNSIQNYLQSSARQLVAVSHHHRQRELNKGNDKSDLSGASNDGNKPKTKIPRKILHRGHGHGVFSFLDCGQPSRLDSLKSLYHAPGKMDHRTKKLDCVCVRTDPRRERLNHRLDLVTRKLKDLRKRRPKVPFDIRRHSSLGQRPYIHHQRQNNDALIIDLTEGDSDEDGYSSSSPDPQNLPSLQQCSPTDEDGGQSSPPDPHNLSSHQQCSTDEDGGSSSHPNPQNLPNHQQCSSTDKNSGSSSPPDPQNLPSHQQCSPANVVDLPQASSSAPLYRHIDSSVCDAQMPKLTPAPSAYMTPAFTLEEENRLPPRLTPVDQLQETDDDDNNKQYPETSCLQPTISDMMRSSSCSSVEPMNGVQEGTVNDKESISCGKTTRQVRQCYVPLENMCLGTEGVLLIVD